MKNYFMYLCLLVEKKVERKFSEKRRYYLFFIKIKIAWDHLGSRITEH